jgi:8-amino-7-oxononanoate synthase
MKNLQTFIEHQLALDEARGMNRQLNAFSGRQGAKQILNGKEVVMLSSNNYLSLADNEFIQNSAIEAVQKYGIGSCASRTISGTLTLHEECETTISNFKGSEASLLFSCGYMANVGVITTVASKGDLILSDELNHASIIDGCRLSKAETRVFKHKDVNDLQNKLIDRENYRNVFLITDGVFSMDGDIAPLNDYSSLSKKYNFAIIVDDAHGVGVLGAKGRGTPHHFGVEKDISITIGTLGKAIGCYGAYITCSRSMRQFIVNRARPFIFTTSLPPFVVASAMASFKYINEHGDSLVAELQEKTKYYRKGIALMNIFTFGSETNIIPLYTGSIERTMSVSARLRELGIFAHGIRPPAVPENQGRIRTTILRSHSYEQLDLSLELIKKIFI